MAAKTQTERADVNEDLFTISVIRRGLLPLGDAPATPSVLAAVVAELTRLGVRVVNPEDLNDSVLDHWPSLHAALVNLRGGDKNYAPLFPGFPNNLPDFDNAALRFSLALSRLVSIKLTRVASSAVDGEAFSYLEFLDDVSEEEIEEALDFSGVGWWPASSIPQRAARAALAEASQDLLPPDSTTQWVDLRVTDDHAASLDLRDFVALAATSPTSLPAGLTADLNTLITAGLSADVDLATVTFRETRALFLNLYFDQAVPSSLTGQENIDAIATTARAQLTSGAVSPDDILRLLAARTDSDVSLATPVKFPGLNRRQRRLVMDILESSHYRADLWRRAGLWRALAKSLHAAEYTKTHPMAAAAIGELRTNRRDHESIRSRYEAALRASDILSAIEVLNTPSSYGVVLRELSRLAALVSSEAERTALLDLLATAAAEATPTRLLDLALVIEDNGASYPRLAITKAGSVLAVPGPKGRRPLARPFVSEICELLRSAAVASIKTRDSWEGERVWVDDAAKQILVPTQMRSVSPSRLQVERGSRLPLGDSPVLRLFVHWQEPSGERSDLDLSCAILGEDFAYQGHVSWTSLREGGIVHSGDLTSAPGPLGASEFIDINLDTYNSPPGRHTSRARYLVPMIFRFTGPNFGDLTEAFAGWMLRDKVSSSVKTFDPATVHTAFDLAGSRSTAIPMVVDTWTRTILYVDAFTSSRDGLASTIESSQNHVIRLIRALDARGSMRTTVETLIRANADARGAVIVENREDATITVGMDDDCTYNAGRAEQILGLS
jgi:hypothetical protein